LLWSDVEREIQRADRRAERARPTSAPQDDQPPTAAST
jgi:hypothetical protein